MDTITLLLLGFGAGVITTALISYVIHRRTLALADHNQRVLWEQTKREWELERRETRLKDEAELALQRESMDREQKEILERIAQTEQEIILREKALAIEESHLASSRDAAKIELGALQGLREQYREKLLAITRTDQAVLLADLREETARAAADELIKVRHECLSRGENEVQTEASRILIDVMQRFSNTTQSQVSATLVSLPNDDMKGRIIGREGRNIKTFEIATGTTLMIDETPDTVLISSFDPVKREIARIALERLIQDGRIHPTSIEEEVSRAEAEMRSSVIGLGERVLLKLRIDRLHPEVVGLLGKLHFRLSNNQNTLDHSVEVAYLCSLLASELGLDPEIAKRAGLLHDIGKAIDYDYEGSHATAAARILKRHGEDPRVVNAVAAHHQEVPPESLYAGLVILADSLSGNRPGARSEAMEGFIQRVRSLEATALGFKGVKEAFALQAGREIRVLVSPEVLNDIEARQLARKIRARIEEELHYPGTIKVTVIREQRYQEVAK